MITFAQCAAGARDHEEKLRLFEALERMPARHRSVSALALVQALTMPPDIKYLGKGLHFVLKVSTHLAKSENCKVLLVNPKTSTDAAIWSLTDQTQELMRFVQSCQMPCSPVTEL